METIQSIEDRFNQKFHYDYTFLNDEPFTDEFIYLISTYIPQGKINFGIIPPEHWSYPDHINTTACSEIRANFADVPYGDSESYRHMCRFFSGFFYKQPMVRQYEYYWRIEPGIKLHCDVNQDVFRFMKENDKKYGFAISLFEYSETIPSLWSFVIDYISKQKSSRPELLPMLQNGFGWYNLCHFWSNFEIARVDVFDNYEYEQFFQYLDSKEGFYYERWGDAPIHTIGICLFLKKQDIHWFDNLGYYHPPYLQCPQDPESYINNKCTCDPDDDINSNENLSCKTRLSKWYQTMSQKQKCKIIRELSTIILSRRAKMCNVLEYRDSKVIYRRYASLFFVIGVDNDDNELIGLEVIHRFVEQMDKIYGNVCELDIIFGFDKAYHVLDELLIDGHIQESSKKEVLKRVTQQDELENMDEFEKILA
ncbi:hypothetical protein KGF56_001296 [Candida oxycetoniae]|uniref:AP-1 complex subunit sigma-1 n=1 Tax=Candida oxycetoniae TaxID=497107 RepID=A0AAI9T0B2_9ASCO|nr:uncharacterized protein KGF56_001296 [Candida oxycetoniae]KAI3406077.1 hypothetical protein KGF56_001296 [Candida oxycetoniae]